MTNEYEKEVIGFCRRLMNRHLGEAVCMFDRADSRAIEHLRYFTAAEYATPIQVREQWALSWASII